MAAMKRVVLFLLVVLSACAPAVPQQDLYVDAQNARATADSAQDLAEFQERFLTATAEAPIIHITETAAGLSQQSTVTAEALAYQQQYWTATAQSVQETQTAAMTATAMAWTPTPNATSTAVFAALNAEGTQIANNVKRDNLELERQEISNQFWASVSGLTWAFFALVAVAILAMWMRLRRYKPAQVDGRGNPLPELDVVEGIWSDPDRMPNYVGGTRREDMKALPAVTADRQDAVTQRDQLTDLATRGLPNDPTQRERKKLAGQEAMNQLGAPSLESRFKILDDGNSNLEVIDGEVVKELDQAWKETK